MIYDLEIIEQSPVAALGETPIFYKDMNSLVWVDILSHCFFLLNVFTGVISTFYPGFMVSAVLPATENGKVILVSDAGIFLYEIASATVVKMLCPYPEKNTRPNEAQISPQGELYFGTMNRNGKANAGSWYRFAVQEGMRRMETDVSIPNTLVFDGGRIIFGDTTSKHLYSVPADSENWEEDKEVILWLEEGGADGSCLSANGILINARWGLSALSLFNINKNMEVVAEYFLPVKQPSSCTLVSLNNNNYVYITSARINLVHPGNADGKLLRAKTTYKAGPIYSFQL